MQNVLFMCMERQDGAQERRRRRRGGHIMLGTRGPTHHSSCRSHAAGVSGIDSWQEQAVEAARLQNSWQDREGTPGLRRAIRHLCGDALPEWALANATRVLNDPSRLADLDDKALVRATALSLASDCPRVRLPVLLHA